MIVCTKTKYSTKEFAEAEIKRIVKKKTDLVLYTYFCKCGCWHVTKRKSFKKEIQELGEVITKLTEENKKLKVEIHNLKLNFHKNASADLRVKNAETKANRLDKVVKGLRNNNAGLIGEIYRLKRESEPAK